MNRAVDNDPLHPNASLGRWVGLAQYNRPDRQNHTCISYHITIYIYIYSYDVYTRITLQLLYNLRTEYNTLDDSTLILLLEVESTALSFPGVGRVWMENNIYITVHGWTFSPTITELQMDAIFRLPFPFFTDSPDPFH